MLYHDLWMEDFQPNSTFVVEGFQPQQIFVFAHYTFVCKRDQQHHNVLPLFIEGYQSYSTFVEEGIRPQHSFMFYNVSFVTLWHSSKAADRSPS